MGELLPAPTLPTRLITVSTSDAPPYLVYNTPIDNRYVSCLQLVAHVTIVSHSTVS